MKQFNNKILIIILLVLVAAFALTRLFRAPALQSNLDGDIFRIDTAKIVKIQLKPIVEPGNEFFLLRDGNNWRVSNNSVTSNANENLIENLLTKITSLKAERIVTRKESKWNDYNVGDSTGTNVLIVNGEEQFQFVIGKESGGVTYVRPYGEDEVYAMNGSFASTFNQKFEDWRDQTFLRIKPESVAKISFQYPSDSGFVLTRNSGQWKINQALADSAKTASYLDKLRYLEVDDFADDFKPTANPDVQLSIEVKNKTINVKGWKTSFAEWVLTSDIQPNVFFLDKGNIVTEYLLPGKNELMK